MNLAPIRRRTGVETFLRSDIQAPSIALARNLLKNGVDRFDQLRSTNAVARKEQRLPRSIFAFALDAAILNSHWLRGLRGDTHQITTREFKRLIAESLASPEIAHRAQNCEFLAANTPLHEYRGDSSLVSNMPRENANKKSSPCYLCLAMKRDHKRRASIYGCVQCRRAFHVNCFALHHFREAAKRRCPLIESAITAEKRGGTGKQRGDRKSLLTGSLGACKLSFQS